MKTLFVVLALNLLLSSCSQVNLPRGGAASSEAPTSGLPSAGPAQAIVELSGLIMGPEIECSEEVCEAEMEWE